MLFWLISVFLLSLSFFLIPRKPLFYEKAYNNGEDLWRVHPGSDTLPSAFKALSLFILPTSQRGAIFYPHSTHEETEAQEGSHLFKQPKGGFLHVGSSKDPVLK